MELILLHWNHPTPITQHRLFILNLNRSRCVCLRGWYWNTNGRMNYVYRRCNYVECVIFKDYSHDCTSRVTVEGGVECTAYLRLGRAAGDNSQKQSAFHCTRLSLDSGRGSWWWCSQQCHKILDPKTMYKPCRVIVFGETSCQCHNILDPKTMYMSIQDFDIWKRDIVVFKDLKLRE